MSREIKFRGQRVDTKEWVYGILIQMDSDSSQCFIFPYYEGASTLTCGQLVSMRMVPVIRETVGQYSGLHDKNGVEIYDGDIVKCTSELFSNFGKCPTGKYITEYYEICPIYGEYSYCFGIKKLSKDYISKDILKSVAEKYYEVIGNIHEKENTTK